MKFIFRGQYSRVADEVTLFGVTFKGREPSEVTEAPAIAWFGGHPEFEQVGDDAPAPKKAPAKKAAAK